MEKLKKKKPLMHNIHDRLMCDIFEEKQKHNSTENTYVKMNKMF